MNDPASEHGAVQGEFKFKVGDQWFYRGNMSPRWFFLTDRPDGSATGIAEAVPKDWWFLLEEIAALSQHATPATPRQ